MPKYYINYWILAKKYYLKHLIMQLLWFRVLRNKLHVASCNPLKKKKKKQCACSLVEH